MNILAGVQTSQKVNYIDRRYRSSAHREDRLKWKSRKPWMGFVTRKPYQSATKCPSILWVFRLR